MVSDIAIATTYLEPVFDQPGQFKWFKTELLHLIFDAVQMNFLRSIKWDRTAAESIPKLVYLNEERVSVEPINTSADEYKNHKNVFNSIKKKKQKQLFCSF